MSRLRTKLFVDGIAYPVIERLGYVPDVGGNVVEVETDAGPKKVIGNISGWRFWTAEDRTAPLKDAGSNKP